MQRIHVAHSRSFQDHPESGGSAHHAVAGILRYLRYLRYVERLNPRPERECYNHAIFRMRTRQPGSAGAGRMVRIALRHD
jgi:hypothetical protein